MDDRTQLLRHTLATLAYRLEKAIRDIPPGFDGYRCGAEARTPLAILAHIGDLLEWGERLAAGEYRWEAGVVLDWDAQRGRVFAALARFDARLRAGPTGHPAEQIFQGPIADALTHVGQLTLLRRLAGAPVRPESYARASIAAGQVGPEQPAERVEFDGDASARSVVDRVPSRTDRHPEPTGEEDAHG
jgi:hypothetical protein